MTYRISKEFHLSYSHQLRMLPDDHPCARVHGHNAIIKVTLASEQLDSVGFVVDYGALKPLGEWLDATFDHRHLNDVTTFNPTAENLAYCVYTWCEGRGWPVESVGWSETPKTWAVFSE